MKLIEVYKTIKEGPEEHQIFCDMDGVLVDFEKGFPIFIKKLFTDILQNPYGKHDRKLIKLALRAAGEAGANLMAGEVPDITIDQFNDKINRDIRNFSYEAIKQFDEEFWLNLDWMPDGKRLWGYIKPYNPIILSSPIGEAVGKYLWLKKNIGYGKDRVVLTHQKFEYAQFEGKIGILIDDKLKNTSPFEQHDGIAILHTDAASTINELKKLGF